MPLAAALSWPDRVPYPPVPRLPRGEAVNVRRRGTPMGSDEPVKTEPDAARLIAAIADRQDRASFAALFDYYAPRIKTVLMRGGVPADTAEDLAQEALLTVWRKASYFDPARASVSAWIFTIARNQRIDGLRRDQRARLHALYGLIEPEEPERPDAALASDERDRKVRAALTLLPDDQVRVVRLSFFEGLPHADIARALSIPLGTVKSRLRLAADKLRDHLGDLA